MPSSKIQSPEDLVERARKGSRSALNHVMKSCREDLLRKAKARLPRSPARQQDAEDLVQQCLLEAWSGFVEFRGQGPAEFRAWIGTILDRKVLLHEKHWQCQKRDRKREEPQPTTGGAPDVPAGSTTSILGRLVREEDLDLPNVAAGWCRRNDRDVITLHLYEDRSYEDIAAEWGVACDAVRKRFSRAVRRVGEAMRLQALMTRHGISPLMQEVIGVHQFQGADSSTIAARLRLPEPRVILWLKDAELLIREFNEEKP
jgi:RNA polymerase sigma factor (sigma-70 family)